MIKIGIIIFRECLEISLLFGVIMAITRNIANSRVYIIAGTLIGIFLASVFAFLTRTISTYFSGGGDEIFDASVIMLTVLMLGWTVVWMQNYDKKVKRNFNDISNKINAGSTRKLMLIILTAVTILREGTEIILSVYSISSTENIIVDDYLLGLMFGAFFGLLAGILIYWGLIKFIGRYIFKVSSVMLALIAAALASDAAGILTSAGIIESFSDQLWDSSGLISDFSIIGRLLKILIGYTSKPNGMQLIFYLGTILIITFISMFKEFLRKKEKIVND